MIKSSEHLNRLWHPIWFLSLSLFLVFIVRPLVRQGMFLDGVFYAAIAKNLSIGHGTLWQPYYSQTEHTIFYEHPPLAIYFQSLFFKLLGQGFGVEQLYSFLMAMGQLSIISWYWLKKENTAFMSLGLLLFIWVLIPLNSMYTCNMLEASLTLFTTIATYLLLIRTKTRTTFLIQNLASAIAVLVAFLCNGPTALFTIVVPFIQAISEGQPHIIDGLKKTLVFIIILTTTFISFYLLVPEALQNTQHYLHQQLLASVIGDREIKYPGIYHLHILYLYFRAYWLVTIVSIICIIISARISKQDVLSKIKQQLENKVFQLFLMLSLVSSLPVGISHKQAFNYIMQSAPFFTLAMMSLCFEPFTIIATSLKNRTSFFNKLYRASYIICALCLITVVYFANGYNRNETMIKDIHYLSHYFENDTVLSTSHSIYFQWITSAYFARHSMVSITPEPGQHYYLALKSETIPENYHLVNTQQLMYYKLAEYDKRREKSIR